MSQNKSRKYVRFKKSVVAQHMLLTLSLIGLMVSAYALYNLRVVVSPGSSYFFSNVIDWKQIHVISGFILSITLVWHLLYILFSIYGHNDFMQMFLTRSELNFIFKLGFYKRREIKSRFGLQEKVTYWVIGIYIVLMLVTGYLRLAHHFSINYLSKGFYVWMVEFHSYNGLLLGLILISWHLYSVFLKPGRFPGTLSWWDGKISEKEMIRRGDYMELKDNNITDSEIE